MINQKANLTKRVFSFSLLTENIDYNSRIDYLSIPSERDLKIFKCAA